jgi:hypothetical protein
MPQNPIYIEFSDYSLVIDYLAERTNQPVLECLLDEKLLKIQKIKLSSISDLENYLQEVDDLFDSIPNQNTSSVQNDILVDLQDIGLSNNVLEYINQKLTETTKQLYLYSSIKELTTEDKKSLKKNNFELKELKKPNPNTILQIAIDCSQKLSLNLPSSNLQNLAEQSVSYTEIIEDLEFISLSKDYKNAYNSLIKKQKTPLFMRGFRIDNLQKDTTTWAKEVDDSDLQLALSLIYTKLSKTGTPKSKKILQDLILTDQKIKNSSKVKPLTWYKLFLWKTKNL